MYQNLTNRARWNKRDIVWTCASSLSSPSSLISLIFHVHSQLVLFARFGVFRFVIVKAWKVALQGANKEADEVLSPNQCVIKDEACSPRSTEVG